MDGSVKTALIVIVVTVLALIILIRIQQRRKRRREMRRQAEDRLREEALDRVLTGRVDGGKGAGPSVPFDVKYDADQRKQGAQARRVPAEPPLMLQLTEYSELSTRKYMFHVSDRVTLGKAGSNDIIIKGERIAEEQCEIFCIQKALYVKNTGTSGMVFLSRKHHKIMVDAQAVILENNDKLQIGGYLYKVELLRGQTGKQQKNGK